MSKLRVAIIGTGMIANSAHFPALNILREEGLIEVVGVADIREEVAAETAARHAVPNYYKDPQKMLDELKPDFVPQGVDDKGASGRRSRCLRKAYGTYRCRCKGNVADGKGLRQDALPVSVHEMEKLYAAVEGSR